MTEEPIKEQLLNKATKQFGDIRAAELARDIDNTASELVALQKYKVAVEDEP